VTVVLDGDSLALADVVRVAREREPVEFAPAAIERMREARALVERAIDRGDAVYGLTTGVGARKRIGVPRDELREFNRMLLLNHRTGQGPPLSEEIVRATMLRLANGFAKGTPGVRVELADRVLAALNGRAEISVRSLGSLGQADLAPMADLGFALVDGFELAAKEAHALYNNNSFSTGMAALAVHDAEELLDSLDVAAALDLEAFAANLTILHPRVAEMRPYPGIASALTRLRELLAGSSLWDETPRNLQDPLTFRCIPQIHGALRDVLSHVAGQLAIELNASQDNPLPVPEEDRIVSVGNFEILPLAAALDYLRIALAPVLTSAGERVQKLLDGRQNGLTDGLAPEQGLAENSLGELGVTAAALVGEARLLAQPVSFELVTTTHAEGIEDRMTFAPLAARRLAEMVDLGTRITAIELVVAAQAVDLRSPPSLGAGTKRALELVRGCVAFTGVGDPLPQDLEPVRGLLPELARL
jgi:histidine ammonia-lyase